MRGSVRPGTSQPMWPLLSARSSVRMEECIAASRSAENFKRILYLPPLWLFPYRCVIVGRILFEIAPLALLAPRHWGGEAPAGHGKYWQHITFEILHWGHEEMQGVIHSGLFVGLYVATLIRKVVGGNVENVKKRLLVGCLNFCQQCAWLIHRCVEWSQSKVFSFSAPSSFSRAAAFFSPLWMWMLGFERLC